MSGMSNLLPAAALLADTFNKYAKAEGNPDTLTKQEVRTLLEKELMEDAKSSKASTETLMETLDLDGDGELNFQEFMIIVVAASDNLRKMMQQCQC